MVTLVPWPPLVPPVAPISPSTVFTDYAASTLPTGDGGVAADLVIVTQMASDVTTESAATAAIADLINAGITEQAGISASADALDATSDAANAAAFDQSVA